MRRLMEWLRRTMCDHVWRTEELPGYEVKDGRFLRLYVRECVKCGKQEYYCE